MGGHVLQQIPDNGNLPPAVIAGCFHRREVALQFPDRLFLRLNCGRLCGKAAAGLCQPLVEPLHLLLVRPHSIQPGHALKDRVDPEPACFRPGRFVLPLVTLDSILPFYGIGGEALFCKSNIKT